MKTVLNYLLSIRDTIFILFYSTNLNIDDDYYMAQVKCYNKKIINAKQHLVSQH